MPIRKNRFPSRAFPSAPYAASAVLLAGLLYLGCSQPEEENACPDDGTQILLTSPKGGESFRVGDSLHVKWKLCNSGSIEINAVDPMLSPDGGTTWCYLKLNSIPVGAAGFGDYAWKIPDSIGLQGEWFRLRGNPKCRVKVEQYSTADAKQRSIGGIFAIE